MDWVDYKKHVIRYRIVYRCSHRHIHWLLASCVEAYGVYRSCTIEGKEEWRCAEKLGWFLYFFAELENMVQQVRYEKKEMHDNEWGMIANAVHTIKKYQKKQISGETMEVRVAEWVRMYYPIVYTLRQFKDGIAYSVHSLQEKNGY